MINIDFNVLKNLIVPPVHKVLEILNYLDCGLRPIQTLHDNFQDYYERKHYELQWNGQITYLTHVLNDQFDVLNRRIHIEDYNAGEDVYLWNKSESNELTYLFNANENELPVYLFNNQEQTIGFIVYVPQGQINNYDALRSWINKYKLASKTYIIIEE